MMLGLKNLLQHSALSDMFDSRVDWLSYLCGSVFPTFLGGAT